MRVEIRPELSIQLVRCHVCSRWHGTESLHDWECGHCLRRERDSLNNTIGQQRRSISALRGVAKRRRVK